MHPKPILARAHLAGLAGARVLALALVLVLVLPVAPLHAAASGADAVLGLWLTEKTEAGQATVRIEKRGDRYRGTIVALDEPRFPPGDPMAGKIKVDRENPNPDLRDREIVGIQIVRGFRYAGDGLWEGGTIYDPESGKTYKATLRLADDGTLDLRGYVGIPLFGRTTTWTRKR